MKKEYKTPAETKNRFWSDFKNADLGNSLERHLTNCIDNKGVLTCEYGTIPYDHEGCPEKEWFIDVEDSSYWYGSLEDRNFDIHFLEKIVTEFRRVNKLKQSQIFIL